MWKCCKEKRYAVYCDMKELSVEFKDCVFRRAEMGGHMVETGAVWILGVMCLMALIWIFGSEGRHIVEILFEVIVKLMCRCALGVMLLYGGNLLFQQYGYATKVGINGVTMACVTFLGLPGTFLLWGISFF